MVELRLGFGQIMVKFPLGFDQVSMLTGNLIEIAVPIEVEFRCHFDQAIGPFIHLFIHFLLLLLRRL